MIHPFENYSEAYEQWFEDNNFVYMSELDLLKNLVPESGIGIEIGIGTGRFALPLNIEIGIDPSPKMKRIASKKGATVLLAEAENIPFKDGYFDYALMVTTLCFLSNPHEAFDEVNRILKRGGSFIIGFVDKDSPLGKVYLEEKHQSRFYKDAVFYSVEEVIDLLEKHHFNHLEIKQTVFRDLSLINNVEAFTNGHGTGSFIGIKAKKL